METDKLMQRLKSLFDLYIGRKFTGEIRIVVNLSQGGISKVKFGHEEVVK